MKNFLSLENLELKSTLSIKSFISASSEMNGYPIVNILQEDKNIWLSEEFLPQEIILNFRNIKLKEHPKKLTAIGIYCWNKYPTNPKIIEVLISKETGNNFISLGHFDLSYKAGRQLIYLDDDNDIELENLLNTVNFNNLIIKLIIKETFGGKHTYLNNLYLYDNIDTNIINSNSNLNNNMDMNLNPNANNHYMYIDDNNDNNYNDNELNNINDINELNDMDENDNKNLNMNLKQNNNSPPINNNNDNENQELINENININDIKNFEENLSPNLEEDNSSDYKSKTMAENFNKKRIKSSRGRENETKTPKIFKKYSNQEDRPMTGNSLSNRIINTTIRQYKNKNLLDYDNNSINNMTKSPYNNINGTNRLSQLINEFRNYKESQESIMSNYENRVKLLEDKCNELKNTMKKMNAMMNTIIESQYSQSQASNDNLIKECQNMINEAIVNVLSNMGGPSVESYSLQMPPIYPNYPMGMKKIKNMNNMNNNMFFNNYNSIPTGRISANYIYDNNFRKKEMNFDNMNYINLNSMNNNNMNNYYDDNNMENYIYDNNNENENEDNNMNDENDRNENYNGAEYLEQEIKNMENEQLNNNSNNDNENNMDYLENENNINNVENNMIENNNLKENNIIESNVNSNINERNNDTKTVKSLHSNDLYNDGLIPYEERIRSNPKKYSNLFAKSSNNYRVNKTNIITRNNNNSENNNQPITFNSEYEIRPIKTLNSSKNNSNSNIFKSNNQTFTELKENANNKTYLIKNSSKLNIKKLENNANINNDEINKDLSSSDNSIDNIQINTKITESILKPTLEKFENYMSLNNNNNFGKSQNIYSAHSFSTKKEIFGENIDKNKEIKGKNKDDNDGKKNVKKKENIKSEKKK